MKIKLPEKVNINNIKDSLGDTTKKVTEWLDKQGDVATYDSNRTMMVYIAAIIVVACLIFGSMLETTYQTSHSETVDEFTENVEVIVVSAESSTSNDKTTYKTVLKYADEEYTFKNVEVYIKCKGMDGLKIDWEIKITIDDKGDISYELDDLDSD